MAVSAKVAIAKVAIAKVASVKVLVSVCLCVYVSMCLCVYVSMCLCAFASMCLCAYVSMRPCVHVSMCPEVQVSRCQNKVPGLIGVMRTKAGSQLWMDWRPLLQGVHGRRLIFILEMDDSANPCIASSNILHSMHKKENTSSLRYEMNCCQLNYKE